MDLLEKVKLLEKEAADFGFRWENVSQIMQQIQSEYLEINEHLDSANLASSLALQEEIGDLLHAVFSLCFFCNFDPKETLEKTLKKFEQRLKAVKEISQLQGLDNLEGLSVNVLMQIWNQAKKQVG